MSAASKIFIDGEAGTTGLEIREKLANVAGADVISINPARRKDVEARAEMMREADLIVLCLPDNAARDAVALADSLGGKPRRILDASTAFRTDHSWVYGFAEIEPGQGDMIAAAHRVANPGCYPTGAIALIRPLVAAGLLPEDYPITINAVSGYSGGGRQMIEQYEGGNAPSFELYALGLSHKHMPELMKYTRLARRPIFVPSVGHYRQGMLVSIPVASRSHERGDAGRPRNRARKLLRRWRIGACHSDARRTAARAGGPERDRPARIARLCRCGKSARRFWSRGSTISARAHRVPPCRTSS